MPSLLGSTVAQNYGRMTAQQTYGVGQIFSQFGTRQYRFLKVVATQANGSTPVDFTDASHTALSKFAVAVRAIQTVAEVNMVFTPGTAGFIIIVSDDTANDSNADTNVPGGYGDAEAAVLAALAYGGSATVTITTVDIDSTGIAIA